MINKYLRTFFLIFLLILGCTVSAQSPDTVKRTIDSISNKILMREYEKAYASASFLIQLYKTNPMSAESVGVCEQAVEMYSQDLLAKQKWKELIDLGNSLSGAPLSVQKKAEGPIALALTEMVKIEELARIQNAKNKKAAILQKKVAVVEEKKTLIPDTEIKSVSQDIFAPEDSVQMQIAKLSTRIDLYLITSIVFFAIFCMLFLICLIYVIKTQKRKVETVRTVNPFPLSYIQSIAPDVASQKKKNGLFSEEIETMSAHIDEKELLFLVEQCSAIGRMVDTHTNRKNNAQDVAFLVYEISRTIGYSHQAASLCYAVGLIHDISFLSCDQSLFLSAEIKAEDRTLLRSHTLGMDMLLLLIHTNYRSLFLEGISNHHENMDGTGYPRGLKGKEIPYLSKVIRVAECYVSLISNRPYRSIYDKNAALEKLQSCSSIYDTEILLILEAIVK